MTKQVAVVGGGLAGAATALSLADLGKEVVVLEAATVARDAVGECLSPVGKGALFELGVGYGEVPKLPCNSIRSCWGVDEITERDSLMQPGGYGDLVDRKALSAEVTREARERGVEWVVGAKVFSVSGNGGKWSLRYRSDEGFEREIGAEWVVDATGRSGAILRHLGVAKSRLDSLTAVALRLTPVETKTFASVLWIEAVRDGWWYLSPMPGGDLRLVYLTDADLLGDAGGGGYWRSRWRERLEEAVHIRGVLGDQLDDLRGEPQIVPSGSQRADQVCGEGWIAVGDSACAFDPLSSYGMTAALGGGIYAGRAVAAAIDGEPEVLDVYREQLDASFRAYRDQLGEQYRQERRWPESPFWARRDGGAV